MADKQHQYLSVIELAKRLDVNPKTVYRLAQEGTLPGFKIGNQWRFDEQVLEEWVRAQCQRNGKPHD